MKIHTPNWVGNLWAKSFSIWICSGNIFKCAWRICSQIIQQPRHIPHSQHIFLINNIFLNILIVPFIFPSTEWMVTHFLCHIIFGHFFFTGSKPNESGQTNFWRLKPYTFFLQTTFFLWNTFSNIFYDIYSNTGITMI